MRLPELHTLVEELYTPTTECKDPQYLLNISRWLAEHIVSIKHHVYPTTLRKLLTKYTGFLARLGPSGKRRKNRSLQGLLVSTNKNWGTYAFFRDNWKIKRDLPVSWSLIEILSVTKHWGIAWDSIAPARTQFLKHLPCVQGKENPDQQNGRALKGRARNPSVLGDG